MRTQSGFTLIELLVVIGILAVLTTVLAIGVSGIFGKSAESETGLTIQTLKSGIERFNTNYSYFPYNSLYKLSTWGGFNVEGNVMDPDNTNQGIESLVMALRTRNEGGPFIANDFLLEYQVNTDGDGINANLTNVEGALKLFEIRDGWDNPLVYVNLSELTPNDMMVPLSIMTSDGSIQTVDLNILKEKLISPETQIQAAKGWCIWSFGEDGLNDYGRGDDVPSWPKIETDE